MKRQLMAFAAIAAFTLPAIAPVAALAQPQDRREDRADADVARAPQRDGGRQGGGERRAEQPRPQQSEQRIEPARERPQERQMSERQPDRAREAQPERAQERRDSGNDQRRDRGSTRDERTQERANQITRDAHRAQGLTPPPEVQRRPDGQNGNGRPDRPNGGRPDNGRPDNGRPDNGRPDRPNGGWNGNNGWNGNGPNRPSQGRDWNRDRERRDWNNRFDSNRWQRDWTRSRGYDWWRNDRRFRSWSGVRIGFYFAPGYGYYSVPRQYYGQRYYEGDYLPSIFWRYQMNDYRTYGLGYPPEGTRWVYVDNSIYLIDAYDGYIIDVVRDFWRW